MSNNVNNVTAGKPKVGGAIWRAPVGTALPTDAAAELDAAFSSMGYCSADGLKNSTEISTETVKAWGGDVVLNSQTDKKDTFKTTFIEGLNPEVLKAVHGDKNVSGDLSTGMTVKVNSAELEDYSWVCDMIMRNGVLKRVVIPCASVTAIEEVTYSDSSAVGYGVTLTAMSDGEGNTHYEYFKNPAQAAQTVTEGE